MEAGYPSHCESISSEFFTAPETCEVPRAELWLFAIGAKSLGNVKWNEPFWDSLNGHHKGWFMRVIPSFQMQ